MTPKDELPPLCEARPFTPEEIFLVGWAEETAKKVVPFLNDVLRSLLAVSVSLSGGSLVFMGPPVGPYHRGGAALLFLLGAICALVGAMPYGGIVPLYDPDAIRAHKRRVQRRKVAWVWAAAAFVLAGMVTAAAGLALSPAPR